MSLTLGCIADDFTGGTDLANNLVRAGMRTVQVIGVPGASAAPVADADAVVVALKSRTAPVAEAVAQSLAAARWLRAQGASQIYFKVCSTFDSTPQGNIGPVAEALMDELAAPFAVVTPAFPENARTVFKGHLFVGDVLLSDSSMRNHPLTPMTDANLVRVLQAQLDPKRGRRVGLIDYRCVAQGAPAVEQRIAALQADGFAFAVVDALGDDDLRTLAQASASLGLVVAGSASRSASRRCTASRPTRRRRACRRPAARAPSSRAAVRRRPTRRSRPSSAQAGRPSPSIRCSSPRAATWPATRSPGRRRA